MWSSIQTLIDKGEFDSGLEKLQLISDNDTNEELELKKELFMLKIMLGKSEFSLIKENTIRVLKNFKIDSKDIYYYQIQNILIESLWRSNYFNEALQIAESFNMKALKNNNELFKEQYGYLLYNLSRINLYLGNFKKSETFANESFEIRKNLASKIDLAETLNVLGIIHGYRGESRKAIELYEESLKLRREVGNKKLEAYSLNNIGENYRLQGNVKKALDYYDQCYNICIESNDIEGMRLGLVGKGTIYSTTGYINKALNYYEKCLSLFNESLSPYHKIEILFLVVRLKLIMKKEYEKEYSQIKDLASQFEDKTINFYLKMTKAFIIKENPRIKIKLTAQDLFEEILHDDIVNMEYTILAMESLVELYLIELQISENDSLLENINQLINNMLEIAKNENFFPLMIRTIILQARLALLNNDLGNCHHILEQAYQLAKEKNLEEFFTLIEKENKFINEELTRWQVLVESEASMYQKIKESHLLQYLQDIRKVINEEE